MSQKLTLSKTNVAMGFFPVLIGLVLDSTDVGLYKWTILVTVLLVYFIYISLKSKLPKDLIEKLDMFEQCLDELKLEKKNKQ
jgi:hypothetical protein